MKVMDPILGQLKVKSQQSYKEVSGLRRVCVIMYQF